MKELGKTKEINEDILCYNNDNDDDNNGNHNDDGNDSDDDNDYVMVAMTMIMMLIIDNIYVFFHIFFMIIRDFLNLVDHSIYFISKVLEIIPWPYNVVI